MAHPLMTEPRSQKIPTLPETPHLKGQREWDGRYGSMALQAQNWRLAFFCAALITALLAVALTIQASRATVTPVMVGLNKETGEVVSLGPVPVGPYQPTPQNIKAILADFIERVRAVPSDPVVIKRNWLRAYEFMDRHAADMLDTMVQNDQNHPLKHIGERTVIVQMTSVVEVPESKSYQARWRESIFDKGGRQVDSYGMTGVFTLHVVPPTDLKSLNANPLGVFILSFQWTRDIN